jgi:hypothetical protein
MKVQLCPRCADWWGGSVVELHIALALAMLRHTRGAQVEWVASRLGVPFDRQDRQPHHVAAIPPERVERVWLEMALRGYNMDKVAAGSAWKDA